MHVLFVCTANICRSAYADRLAGHLLEGDPSVTVASAGTYGFDGEPMSEPMAAQLRDRGVDADGFRSRPLTMAMVEEADLVLTAEVAHRQFILDERPGTFRRVFTLGQLVRTLDEAEDRLGSLRGRELLDGLRTGFRPAERLDDVADPYRRGDAAAALAAKHLDELVGRIVPRLTSP